MDEATTDWPAGLPQTEPGECVLDLARVLAPGEKEGITSDAARLEYKAKVVLVDYEKGKLGDLADLTALRWKIKEPGEARVLVMVDKNNHAVHIIRSPKMIENGVSSQFVQSVVIPRVFAPYARQGDIASAIKSSLVSIDAQMRMKNKHLQSSTGQASPGPSPLAGPALVSSIVLIALLAALVFYTLRKSNQKRIQVLQKSLEPKLNDLYTRADELGLASDYIKPGENKELAYRVTEFFGRLQVLDSAHEESKNLKGGAKIEGLSRLNRLATVLIETQKDLSREVNAITGGIDTREEVKELVEKKRETIKLESSRYYQPSWSREREYVQPLALNSAGSGMMDMVMILNQMETNHRLSQLESASWHSQPSTFSQDSSYDIGSDGGSWSGGSSFDSGSDGGSWSDSGSSDSGSDGGSW